MLPHLSRISFCLAGLAAAAALLLPDRRGATLASVAMLALLAALWTRRFRRPPPDAAVPEASVVPPFADVEMMELAARVAQQIAAARDLGAALRVVGELLVHELGARGLRVHDSVAAAALGAVPGGRTVLQADNAFTLPVVRDGQVVAVLQADGLEVAVVPAALERLLELVRAQLDGVARHAAPAEAESATAPLPTLAGRVLVFEDDAADREAAAALLGRFGLQVSTAANPLQGLHALAEAHFDLVLMTVRTPSPGGVDALNGIRRGADAGFVFVTPPATPVIAVTARLLDADENRLLAHGFDDCLDKPLRESPLLAMLTKHLRSTGAAALSMSDKGRTSGGGVEAPAMAVVLDEAALARLRELDPNNEGKLLARIAHAFETSAARYVPQLRNACETHNMEEIGLVAHTIKSSSQALGALELSRQCAEIETMIKQGQHAGLAPRVDAVCAEIGIVLQALKRLLDGMP